MTRRRVKVDLELPMKDAYEGGVECLPFTHGCEEGYTEFPFYLSPVYVTGIPDVAVVRQYRYVQWRRC